MNTTQSPTATFSLRPPPLPDRRRWRFAIGLLSYIVIVVLYALAGALSPVGGEARFSPIRWQSAIWWASSASVLTNFSSVPVALALVAPQVDQPYGRWRSPWPLSACSSRWLRPCELTCYAAPFQRRLRHRHDRRPARHVSIAAAEFGRCHRLVAIVYAIGTFPSTPHRAGHAQGFFKRHCLVGIATGLPGLAAVAGWASPSS